MHLFPNSQLEEVGLCWVDPTSQIPAEWGFHDGDLPPLGASPDGLIRHRATAPPPCPTAPPKPQGLLQPHTANQAPSAVVGPAARLDASETALTSQVPWGLAPHSSMAQVLSTEPAQHQEHGAALSDFEALLAKLQISSNRLSSKHAHIKPQSIATPASADRVAAALPTSAPSSSATTAASCTASSGVVSNNAGHATPPQPEEHQQEWLEAVEIKNVCPFREVREVASNGKAKRLYRLSDPGPYSRVSNSSHLTPISNFSTGLAQFWQQLQCMNADQTHAHRSAWKMALLLRLWLCKHQKLRNCDGCGFCNVSCRISELLAIHLACKLDMPPYYSSASQKRSPNQWHPIRTLGLRKDTSSSHYKGAQLLQMVSGLSLCAEKQADACRCPVTLSLSCKWRCSPLGPTQLLLSADQPPRCV